MINLDGVQFFFRTLNCLMNLQKCVFDMQGSTRVRSVALIISTAKGSITCCTLSKINNITINTHLQGINDSQDVDTHHFWQTVS